MAQSAEDMTQIAALFVQRLSPKSDSATLVTLSGELGAGKTTFAQGIAKALGVTETVTSPTYVLEKIYKLENPSTRGFSRLIHIDAYRLKGAHELEVLGWNELLSDAANLILIEWPERVKEAIPGSAIRIKFDIMNDERIISIDGEETNRRSGE